ncbi:MAG: nuclear transport factor 2 family protein [Myxococcota bacterium]
MRRFALSVLFAAMGCAESPENPSPIGGETETSGLAQAFDDLSNDVIDLNETLASQVDVAALTRFADCYGRGHDLVFFDLGGSQTAALDALGDCFASDVVSEFRFFGAPNGDVLEGLPALVGFIEQFALQSGYNTARNIPGNVNVELLGPDDALVTYSGNTPHFSVAPTDPKARGFVEWFSARYTATARRDADGVWRTTQFDIEIDEVIRQEADFPFGQ